MSTLADVFREFNELKATGLVRNYAIGGATAALFYAEPVRTYDIDVFVLLGPETQRPLASLEPFSQWARTRGFGVDAEHILVHGVPVQFLPAHNSLVEAAVNTARTLDCDDVSVRVIDPEHRLPRGSRVSCSPSPTTGRSLKPASTATPPFARHSRAGCERPPTLAPRRTTTAGIAFLTTASQRGETRARKCKRRN